MNDPIIFLSKTELVTRYVFPEESCVITNKSAYLDDDTWEKVVKVVAPGIIKIMVMLIVCFLILISTYLTLHI